MRLVIIKESNSVGKDHKFYENLDLSSCNLPENLWALQWDNDHGHIEFNSELLQNENITELPAWAQLCINKWEEAENAESVEEETIEPTIDTFWSTYPNADAETVNVILAKEYPGIVNERALDPHAVLKGVKVSIVSEGATALSSIGELKNDCIKLGIPTVSDPITDSVSSNFIKYMTDTLGYSLSENKVLYIPWAGDIITNKADQDINIQREKDIENGVVWNGYIWQIDLVSRNNIMNQLTAITSNVYSQPNVTWRTKDNIDITLTIEEFKQLATAVNNKIEEIYLASFNAKS